MPSIQDVYNKYQGQSLLVPGADPSDAGQCVQAADYFIHEAFGLPYVWLNAIDFWNNPDANLKANFDFIPYSPTMPIKIGDFVIYGSGVGSVYGHISTAIQDGVGSNYVGGDSNWAHNLTLHTQPHNDSYNQYILGILRLKSNNGEDMVTDPITTLAYQIAFNRSPAQGELDTWRGKPVADLLTSLLANNETERSKAANFDNVQTQLTKLQQDPAAQQIEAIRKIIS